MLQNNYFYAGTTAIIYNFSLDYSPLDYSSIEDAEDYITRTGITEFGIRYKKTSDSEWQVIPLPHPKSLINRQYRMY